MSSTLPTIRRSSTTGEPIAAATEPQTTTSTPLDAPLSARASASHHHAPPSGRRASIPTATPAGANGRVATQDAVNEAANKVLQRTAGDQRISRQAGMPPASVAPAHDAPRPSTQHLPLRWPVRPSDNDDRHQPSNRPVPLSLTARRPPRNGAVEDTFLIPQRPRALMASEVGATVGPPSWLAPSRAPTTNPPASHDVQTASNTGRDDRINAQKALREALVEAAARRNRDRCDATLEEEVHRRALTQAESGWWTLFVVRPESLSVEETRARHDVERMTLQDVAALETARDNMLNETHIAIEKRFLQERETLSRHEEGAARAVLFETERGELNGVTSSARVSHGLILAREAALRPLIADLETAETRARGWVVVDALKPFVVGDLLHCVAGMGSREAFARRAIDGDERRQRSSLKDQLRKLPPSVPRAAPSAAATEASSSQPSTETDTTAAAPDQQRHASPSAPTPPKAQQKASSPTSSSSSHRGKGDWGVFTIRPPLDDGVASPQRDVHIPGLNVPANRDYEIAPFSHRAMRLSFVAPSNNTSAVIDVVPRRNHSATKGATTTSNDHHCVRWTCRVVPATPSDNNSGATPCVRIVMGIADASRAVYLRCRPPPSLNAAVPPSTATVDAVAQPDDPWTLFAVERVDDATAGGSSPRTTGGATSPSGRLSEKEALAPGYADAVHAEAVFRLRPAWPPGTTTEPTLVSFSPSAGVTLVTTDPSENMNESESPSTWALVLPEHADHAETLEDEVMTRRSQIVDALSAAVRPADRPAVVGMEDFPEKDISHAQAIAKWLRFSSYTFPVQELAIVGALPLTVSDWAAATGRRRQWNLPQAVSTLQDLLRWTEIPRSNTTGTVTLGRVVQNPVGARPRFSQRSGDTQQRELMDEFRDQAAAVREHEELSPLAQNQQFQFACAALGFIRLTMKGTTHRGLTWAAVIDDPQATATHRACVGPLRVGDAQSEWGVRIVGSTTATPYSTTVTPPFAFALYPSTRPDLVLCVDGAIRAVPLSDTESGVHGEAAALSSSCGAAIFAVVGEKEAEEWAVGAVDRHRRREVLRCALPPSTWATLESTRLQRKQSAAPTATQAGAATPDTAPQSALAVASTDAAAPHADPRAMIELCPALHPMLWTLETPTRSGVDSGSPVKGVDNHTNVSSDERVDDANHLHKPRVANPWGARIVGPLSMATSSPTLRAASSAAAPPLSIRTTPQASKGSSPMQAPSFFIEVDPLSALVRLGSLADSKAQPDFLTVVSGGAPDTPAASTASTLAWRPSTELPAHATEPTGCWLDPVLVSEAWTPGDPFALRTAQQLVTRSAIEGQSQQQPSFFWIGFDSTTGHAQLLNSSLDTRCSARDDSVATAALVALRPNAMQLHQENQRQARELLVNRETRARDLLDTGENEAMGRIQTQRDTERWQAAADALSRIERDERDGRFALFRETTRAMDTLDAKRLADMDRVTKLVSQRAELLAEEGATRREIQTDEITARESLGKRFVKASGLLGTGNLTPAAWMDHERVKRREAYHDEILQRLSLERSFEEGRVVVQRRAIQRAELEDEEARGRGFVPRLAAALRAQQASSASVPQSRHHTNVVSSSRTAQARPSGPPSGAANGEDELSGQGLFDDERRQRESLAGDFTAGFRLARRKERDAIEAQETTSRQELEDAQRTRREAVASDDRQTRDRLDAAARARDSVRRIEQEKEKLLAAEPTSRDDIVKSEKAARVLLNDQFVSRGRQLVKEKIAQLEAVEADERGSVTDREEPAARNAIAAQFRDESHQLNSAATDRERRESEQRAVLDAERQQRADIAKVEASESTLR